MVDSFTWQNVSVPKGPSSVVQNKSIFNHDLFCNFFATEEGPFTVYRTGSWVTVVSTIERFHCIQNSQLGHSGVHYREVSLYIKTESLTM